MLYSFFLIINYIAVMYQILGRFVNVVGYNGKYAEYSEFKNDIWERAYLKFPIALGIIIVLFPICIMRDLTKISWAGFVGVSACSFGVLIVVIQCHKYYTYYQDNVYKADDESTHMNLYHLGKAFTSKLEFFKGYASLAFAYVCHNGVFPVYEKFETNETGLKKFKIATMVSSAMTCGLHVIAVTCAFLTDPITPEDIIVNRKSIDSGYDILMTIAKFVVFCSLIFTLPPYHVTYRICFINLFFKGQLTKLVNILITTISLLVAGVIAVTYEKILNYISYVGGFLTVFFGYLFPILVWIKSNGKGWSNWLNIIELIGALILCAIGIIAGIATIIDDASGGQ